MDLEHQTVNVRETIVSELFSDLIYGYLSSSEKTEEIKKEMTSLFHSVVPKEARMHQILCSFG